MILPEKPRIVAKNSLELELAQMRGYEIPSYNNQRGWTENKDNHESYSQRDSGVYDQLALTNAYMPKNPRLKNLNSKIRDGSI